MSVPKDTAERFRVIAAGFTEQTKDNDWDAQTPCEEWTARDIVGHLISWFAPALEDVGITVELSGDKNSDPATVWAEFADIVSQALDDDNKAEALVTRGPIPGQSLETNARGFFIPDVFMHTWDLARSQGRDVELDADFAETNLGGLRSLGEQLQARGGFGPPQETAADASSTIRLMAYVGRDPNFGLDG
ncbi:TIGR03086 family metal-binding protein [Corynebacterium sp. USCH3]|uniref:TIGR03086 family metal-binding protein n=1 Tax=Corynebacterium sp. USCH3 TaxID=3024840 RepID=UPI0030B3E5C4